jgi:hypothetical protein
MAVPFDCNAADRLQTRALYDEVDSLDIFTGGEINRMAHRMMHFNVKVRIRTGCQCLGPGTREGHVTVIAVECTVDETPGWLTMVL